MVILIYSYFELQNVPGAKLSQSGRQFYHQILTLHLRYAIKNHYTIYFSFTVTEGWIPVFMGMTMGIGMV